MIHVYIYIYTHTYTRDIWHIYNIMYDTCVYMYIHICTCRERERETDANVTCVGHWTDNHMHLNLLLSFLAGPGLFK